jgi:hypothetical protein
MHPYLAARASASSAMVSVTSAGREWEVSCDDTEYVDECKEPRQLDALHTIDHAMPLAVGEYIVRVWTSRGLVDFSYDAGNTTPAVHLDAVDPAGSIGMCGLARCQTTLNARTRLLALEVLFMGLMTSRDDDDEPPPVPVIPVIATVQLDHPVHGTVTLFSL